MIYSLAAPFDAHYTCTGKGTVVPVISTATNKKQLVAMLFIFSFTNFTKSLAFIMLYVVLWSGSIKPLTIL